jgi:hypothetical protein
MSVTISVPLPTIGKVTPVDRYVVEVTWRNSVRPHAVEKVDLSPLIEMLKFYRPLRNNKSLFNSVHVAEDGDALAWGDGSIDMAASSVERMAEEAMTAEDFRDFLNGNSLTQEQAAAVLGRGRRQIANYASGQWPIPRIVVMACYGYQARRLLASGGGGIRGGSSVSINIHGNIGSGQFTYSSPNLDRVA